MKDFQKVYAKLKHTPEDFIVEEIGENWTCSVGQTPNAKLPTPNSENQNFLWCELEKKDIDHFTAIREVSNRLGLNTSAIGYAGSKDKKAWTSQRISIENPNPEQVEKFSHPKIILKNFKWNKRKIKIGYLQGNHFKLTLRDINKKDAMKVSKQIRGLKSFPNYFGSQRFGKNKSNVRIGELILKKKFEEAVHELSEENSRQKEYMQYYLNKKPGDFIGALKTLDRKNTLMLINSVQSKIFNEILETALEEGLNFANKGQTSCLLMGYKSRFYDGRLGEIERQVLASHKLTLEDFDIKEIPHLRMKGSFRKALIEVKDLELDIEDDEEFPESKKMKIKFTLSSGVYATTFLENFFILN